MEIATNFILKTALQNPRILRQSEIPATSLLTVPRGNPRNRMALLALFRKISRQKKLISQFIISYFLVMLLLFALGALRLVNSKLFLDRFAAFNVTWRSLEDNILSVPHRKAASSCSIVSEMKTELQRNTIKDEKVADFYNSSLIAYSIINSSRFADL